jgi:hypothetical protein
MKLVLAPGAADASEGTVYLGEIGDSSRLSGDHAVHFRFPVDFSLPAMLHVNNV